MKVRFWNLTDDDIMEVWVDDILTGKGLLKAIYRTVYQYYEEGFSGRIGIEIITDAGEVLNELRASRTLLMVRIWSGTQRIRRMML